MTAVLIPQHLRGYLIFKQFHTRLNTIKHGDHIPVWPFGGMQISYLRRGWRNLVKYQSNVYASIIVYSHRIYVLILYIKLNTKLSLNCTSSRFRPFYHHQKNTKELSIGVKTIMWSVFNWTKNELKENVRNTKSE